MTHDASDPRQQLRQWIYFLLVAATAGLTAGRILSVERVYEPSLSRDPENPEDKRGEWPAKRPMPMPTFGANDRSRWATIRALVDEGTYAIGRRIVDAADPNKYQDVGLTTEDGWRTIDKVLHPETKEFLSSKPPLLPTVLAGEYWLLQKAFLWTLTDDSWLVVRTILFTVNWLPLVISLFLLSRLVERLGVSDWGRVLVMAAACFGTFLTTFVTTLNNHTVAAWGAMFSLSLFVPIWADGKREAWRFALCGLFAAWTACNELPAASFGVLLFGLLLFRAPGPTLFFFVPAAAVPCAAFLFTNYQAIGQIMPAYDNLNTEWYQYEGSYWKDPKGVDAGKDPVEVYAFHSLLGHHGIFSLTPVFLISVLGMFLGLVAPPPRPPALEHRGREYLAGPADEAGVKVLSGLALLLTLAIVAFYLLYVYYVRETRNYGGWTSGPRWFFWLTPFWLLAMVPAADWLGRHRLGRGLGYLALGVSCLSAAYPAWNPWRHPWLYNLLESLDLIRY